MPYREKKKYRDYMRDYMKSYRRVRRETLASLTPKQKQQLKQIDEKLYQMLYGKRRKQ